MSPIRKLDRYDLHCENDAYFSRKEGDLSDPKLSQDTLQTIAEKLNEVIDRLNALSGPMDALRDALKGDDE